LTATLASKDAASGVLRVAGDVQANAADGSTSKLDAAVATMSTRARASKEEWCIDPRYQTDTTVRVVRT
jgi:hypothetical protein